MIYLSLHCHHQNDSCIKVGSDESHFNVSLIVRDKVARRLSPSTTTFFEERGEPKRNRTEVLLLTSLTPYCLAKPAHGSECLPWCLSSTEIERLIRDGEKGEVIRREGGGGGGDYIPIATLSPPG